MWKRRSCRLYEYKIREEISISKFSFVKYCQILLPSFFEFRRPSFHEKGRNNFHIFFARMIIRLFPARNSNSNSTLARTKSPENENEFYSFFSSCTLDEKWLRLLRKANLPDRSIRLFNSIEFNGLEVGEFDTLWISILSETGRGIEQKCWWMVAGYRTS